MIGEIGEQRSDFGGRQSGSAVSSGHASARARRPASRWRALCGYLRPTSASVAQAISFCFMRRKRLAEPQQRLRRLGVALVLGGEVEEGLRRGVVALALEQALAEPEFAPRRRGGRSDISSGRPGRCLRPARSPCAAHSRSRDRRCPSASPTAARPRPRAPVALRLRDGGGGNGPPSGGTPGSAPGTPRQRRQIERRAGPAAAGRTDRRLGRDDRAAARSACCRADAARPAHWDSATDRTRRSGVPSRAVAAAAVLPASGCGLDRRAGPCGWRLRLRPAARRRTPGAPPPAPRS